MRRRLSCVGLAVLLTAFATHARGQGTEVLTSGACATGRGSAGIASPCRDGSAVLFNPAALVVQSSAFSFGVTSVRGSGSFNFDDDRPEVLQDRSSALLPFGYINYNISPRLSAALGVFTPFAQGTDWPADFAGRYASHWTQLRNYYLQPTLSMTVGSIFSVGLGADIIFGSVEMDQRFDLATTPLPAAYQNPAGTRTYGSIGVPPETDYAEVHLSGRGTGISFHAGVLARIGEWGSIGARYLHSAAMDIDGDADFSSVLTELVLPPGNALSVPGNPLGLPAGSAVSLDPLLGSDFRVGGRLADQNFATNIELPHQLAIGVAFTPMVGLELLADYQWTGWETFESAAIDYDAGATDIPVILDYQNAHAIRLGVEYAASPAFTLRGGLGSNSAAQGELSVSPLLPDAARRTYSLGVGYNFSEKLRFDLGYQLVDQEDRRGRFALRTPDLTDPQLEALNVGVYSVGMHRLTAGVVFQFGPAE